MARSIYEYAKTLGAVGNKVAIRRMEKYHDVVMDGIIIPETADVNGRMTKGEVVSVGREAAEKTGLKAGDLVLYDTMSAFYDHHPVIVTKYENVICKFADRETGEKF